MPDCVTSHRRVSAPKTDVKFYPETWAKISIKVNSIIAPARPFCSC